jgi:hypothetical protein
MSQLESSGLCKPLQVQGQKIAKAHQEAQLGIVPTVAPVSCQEEALE